MPIHKFKKGLRLPLRGAPESRVDDAPSPARVALVAADYVGMKPTMHVREGDDVRRGQLLFDDKKTPGVRYTAPAAGRVVGVHRGARRALESVVIELTDEERAGRGDSVQFEADRGKHPAELGRDAVRDLLIESGMWTALRTRPFGKVADPERTPAAVFVTAVDSNPVAPDLGLILAGHEDAFERGVAALAKLSGGETFVCTAPGFTVPVPRQGDVRVEQFSGPHPSGTVGLHIHTLKPVHLGREVWHAGLQDVIAIGKLFSTGTLDVGRIISLAGPGVTNPRHLRTRIGASTDDLVAGNLGEGEQRVVSGSALSGRIASGATTGFLGRYHQQVTVLPEGREREFLGWLTPGFGKFSTVNAFLSRLMGGRALAMTTSTQGSHRAIVPIGMHEKVFPLDIPASFMAKALVMGDVERATELGVLELEEEDVAVLSFVCASKNDYGPHLRDVLTTIEKEG